MENKIKKLKQVYGSIMTETVFALPVMILTLFIGLDIYRAFTISTMLEKISYEGTRVASDIDSLEPTTVPYDNESDEIPFKHLELRDRILKLINANNLLNDLDINIMTEHVLQDPNNTNKKNFVRVTLETNYNCLITSLPIGGRWFTNFNLVQATEAAYLFSRI